MLKCMCSVTEMDKSRYRPSFHSLQQYFPSYPTVLPSTALPARARKAFSAGYCVQMPPTLEKHAGQPNAEACHPPLTTLPYWET